MCIRDRATADTAVADLILSDERLDFVIGSMHELPNHDDFAFLDYSKENVPKLMEENFSEILKLCQWNKFDVLGHLTYCLLYTSRVYISSGIKSIGTMCFYKCSNLTYISIPNTIQRMDSCCCLLYTSRCV